MGVAAFQEPIRRNSFSMPEMRFTALSASQENEWITSRQNQIVAGRRPLVLTWRRKRSSRSPRRQSQSGRDMRMANSREASMGQESPDSFDRLRLLMPSAVKRITGIAATPTHEVNL